LPILLKVRLVLRSANASGAHRFEIRWRICRD
jgi:hypothetical protein